MSVGIIAGNPRAINIIYSVITGASVLANTTAEQTFTVNGLRTGDYVGVNKPTAQAGLGIVGSRVTAADTIGITYANNTASPIVPTASETYRIFVASPEGNQPAANVER